MKTPDVVKINKGLKCCKNADCDPCPYYSYHGTIAECLTALASDTMAYITQLEQRLASVGKTCPEWISVEDRPPEGQVLVANFAPGTEGYKEMDIGYVEVYEMSDAESPCRTVYDKTGFDIWYNITHWMPLPNIPFKKG